MRFSDTTKELLSALHAAQKTAEPPKKSEKAKGVNYTYTTLGQTLEVFKTHYAPHGLVLNFGDDKPASDNGVSVVIRISHAPSGEWVETTHHTVTDRQNGPQGIGSATTYGRRYGLLGLMGLSPEDDDGQAAQSKPATKPTAVSSEVEKLQISCREYCEALEVTTENAARSFGLTDVQQVSQLTLLQAGLKNLLSKLNSGNTNYTPAEQKLLNTRRQAS